MIEKLGITSGPWSYRNAPHRQGGDDIWCIDWSPDQEEVAEIVHGRSHARLIAASPEMLEALIKEALQAESEWGRAQMETEEAIEKATGRTWAQVKKIIKEE
jgi:hypothetical protein